MENVVIILILLAIVAGIIWYLIRAKKRGETCIGCPYAKQCHKNNPNPKKACKNCCDEINNN